MQDKQTVISALGKSSEDKLLLARLCEKFETAREKGYMTHTHFLDSHQRALCSQALRLLGAEHSCVFFGGFDAAERVVLLCLPDYMEQSDAREQAPIVLLRAAKQKEDTLSHRDYLGALMGLQTKREMLGDILVHDTGADIFVMDKIADFLEQEYQKVGRKRIALTRLPLSAYKDEQRSVQEGEGAVASTRLDAVTALVFRLSRAQAQTKIAQGLVTLNHCICQKDMTQVTEGDLITVRGIGRAKITGLGGISRKGRQFIQFEVSK